MALKILCTVLVISFFTNILATMVGKGARECFHMKVVYACGLITIISALVFFAALILLLLELIWR